jgi:hypothetical protein
MGNEAGRADILAAPKRATLRPGRDRREQDVEVVRTTSPGFLGRAPASNPDGWFGRRCVTDLPGRLSQALSHGLMKVVRSHHWDT